MTSVTNTTKLCLHNTLRIVTASTTARQKRYQLMSSLPKEITDLVLGELGRGPRSKNLSTLIACSTVHSSFVEECQKHIFRTATLLAAPAIYSASDSLYRLYKRTIRFAEIVNTKPHLRRYVKDVTYQISQDIYPTSRDSLLWAMENLNDLESLRLQGVVNPDLNRRHVSGLVNLDRQTQAGMLALMRRNSLKSLTLSCVKEVPLEFVDANRYLEVLTLHSCQAADSGPPG